MRQLKITQSITNRECLSLEKYLQEIAKTELISAEEEASLALRIKQGDQKALDRLTKANLRFVVSVAKQYQHRGLSLADLINDGNLGLIKAARCFDETRGFKFISYAVWWIRQSIMRAIVEQARIVRLPTNRQSTNRRIQKASSTLEQELERAPSAEEVAVVLNMDAADVEEGLNNNGRHVSLDSPMSEGEEGTLLDVLENDSAGNSEKELYHKKSLEMEIGRLLQLLTLRQKETICCFYGIGMAQPLSLEAIGERFNLTKERVRQIKEKAILKLRTKNGNILREYLGS